MAMSPAKCAKIEAPLPTRDMGPLVVSSMGYGAWPLSYDNRPTEEGSIAVLHRALDLGIRFIDTADAYCKDETEKHHNEKLIRKALASYHNQVEARKVVVATKGIFLRPEGRWERCARPDHISKAIAGSHEALHGCEAPIDLWQIHSCGPSDPPNGPDDVQVPMETLLIPVKEALLRGIIRFVGLSNCEVEQIEVARAFLPAGTLLCVENGYSMLNREAERDGILKYCEENGLTFLPWGALGGSKNVGGKGFLRDPQQLPHLNRLAAEKGCSPEGLALKYMATKWKCILHIAGARSLSHLEDSLQSRNIEVSEEEVALLDTEGDVSAK